MLQNDIADGNTIKGPTGELQVAGRITGSHGAFVVLADVESGLCALALEGNLIENEEWTIVNRIAPSGAAQVQETSQLAAQQSEIERLTKLTDALVQQQQQQHAAGNDAPDVPPETVTDPTAPGIVTPATDEVAGAPYNPPTQGA